MSEAIATKIFALAGNLVLTFTIPSLIVLCSLLRETFWTEIIYYFGFSPMATVLPPTDDAILPFFWNILSWHLVDS